MINNLFEESDECAFVFNYNSQSGSLQVVAYTPCTSESSSNTLPLLYLSASQQYSHEQSDPDVVQALNQTPLPTYFVFNPKKKPYKPIAKKVKVQLMELPDKFRIK